VLAPRVSELRRRWGPRHTAASLAGLAAFVAIVIGGYAGHWSWTGFTGNTLWNWLNLLFLPLLVPTVVVPALTPRVLGEIVYLDAHGNPIKVEVVDAAEAKAAEVETEAAEPEAPITYDAAARHSTEGTGNMAGDGSAALGAPEVAGVLVNPRGFGKKAAVGSIGGVVGAVAATAVAARSSSASDLPSFGRVGYVAASDGEVALIKTKSGALKMKVTDEVLARAPREELTRVELDRGRPLSHLRLQFSNGTVWEFDVPKTAVKNGERLVLALGGDIV
jgi:hypothetical protein